jgi:hypothetical protein
MNVPAFALAVPLAVVSAISGRASDVDAMRKEYQEVRTTHAAKWQDREFELAGKWAVYYVSKNPTSTGKALDKWMAALDPEGEDAPQFTVSTIKLADRVFLIAPSFYDWKVQYGTFFVISWPNGQCQVSWRVRDTKDERLAGWGSRLWVTGISRLPASENGHPRFYVYGQYTRSGGSRTDAQVSVWEWEGARAIPLIVRNHSFPYVPHGPIRFDGEYIRVHTEEAFKTFGVHGDSWTSEREWIIQVTPQNVVDLGFRQLHPEVDLIDELRDRIAKGRPATELAAPAVVTALKKDVPARSGDTLNSWTLKWPKLCVSILDKPDRIFTLTRTGGKLFVAGIQDTSPEFGEACNPKRAN